MVKIMKIQELRERKIVVRMKILHELLDDLP